VTTIGFQGFGAATGWSVNAASVDRGSEMNGVRVGDHHGLTECSKSDGFLSSAGLVALRGCAHSAVGRRRVQVGGSVHRSDFVGGYRVGSIGSGLRFGIRGSRCFGSSGENVRRRLGRSWGCCFTDCVRIAYEMKYILFQFFSIKKASYCIPRVVVRVTAALAGWASGSLST